MIYDLINPSDDITFDAPTFESAAVAVVLLGLGRFGAKPEVDESPDGAFLHREIPLLTLGPYDKKDKWLLDNFGVQSNEDYTAFIDRHHTDVVATLRSFATVSVKERRIYDLALSKITEPDKRAEFLAEWDDENRTSLHEIVNHAHQLAERMEQVKQDMPEDAS